MAARPGSVPVTLVLGEEELLAERAVAEAVAVARERLGPGTSVEEVRGGGLPDGFAMGLATASLFGGGRVVVVQEADGLDATAREAVLALAADPGAATAVVLRAAAPGRQAKFFKDVQRDAATVLVAKLRPAERGSWLRAEVRRLGRKADEAAVAALIDTVGQDLRELAGAVAKLHVAVPPPTLLTAGHVTEFLAQTADRGIFELTDAVFAADAATALDRLDALIDQGEDPIRLLGFIASQLRLLLRVADHPELPKAQVAGLLGGGVRDWQVDRARRQLRRFRPGDLHRALDLIAEADAHIRNGTSSSRLLLELLIARLAGAGAAAALPGPAPGTPVELGVRVGLLALLVDRAGQAGLVVGGVVLVDDALAGGAVVGAGGAAQGGFGGFLVAGGDALADAAGVGLQGRADRLVAQAGLLVLPVALDLRLDVGQERALLH